MRSTKINLTSVVVILLILCFQQSFGQRELRLECETAQMGGIFNMATDDTIQIPNIIVAPDTIEYFAPNHRKIIFIACDEIILKDGFRAVGGTGSSYFHAYIDGSYCTTNAFTLKEKLDGTYYEINTSQVPFYYFEKYTNIDEVQYEIYNSKHEALFSSENLPPSSTITYGNNVVTLDLRSLMDSQTLGDYYILEVTDPKGMKFYARFKFFDDVYSTTVINTCGTPDPIYQ